GQERAGLREAGVARAAARRCDGGARPAQELIGGEHPGNADELPSASTWPPEPRQHETGQSAWADQEAGCSESAIVWGLPAGAAPGSDGPISSETVYAAATIQAAIKAAGTPHSRSFCICNHLPSPAQSIARDNHAAPQH